MKTAGSKTEIVVCVIVAALLAGGAAVCAAAGAQWFYLWARYAPPLSAGNVGKFLLTLTAYALPAFVAGLLAWGLWLRSRALRKPVDELAEIEAEFRFCRMALENAAEMSDRGQPRPAEEVEALLTRYEKAHRQRQFWRELKNER